MNILSLKDRGKTLKVLIISFQLVLSLCAFGQEQKAAQVSAIDWKRGPLNADLGGVAEISVPQGFLFTDKKGAQKLLELTQNIPNGREVGAIVPTKAKGEDRWFVIFEFHEVGFVRDDEKDKLDSNALLQSIQNATEEGNKVRAERGWPAFHVVGWEKQPFYDQHTNNLTWATLGKDEKGEESVNHSIRILGRRGTMNVDVVMDPPAYESVVTQFDQLVGGFKYQEGSRYSDFMSGDKVASYGLTALIAGGAGALAVKTGLLMKMWKFFVAVFAAAWKAIVAVFVAVLAWIRKMLNKLLGRREEESSSPKLENPEEDSVALQEANSALDKSDTK